MMDGTYEIRTYLSKTNYETNTLVLYTQDGKLNGYIGEIVYRPVPLTDGKVDGDSFYFDVPPFITIYADLTLKLSAKREGDNLSGYLEVPGIAKFPLTGRRVGDAVIPDAN